MTDSPSKQGGELSRRRLLASSAAAGGAVWLLRGLVRPGSAYAASAPPPGFPAGIDLYQRVYENWAGEIRTDQLWTSAPRDPHEVLAVVNWAYGAGWTVRAQGHRHSWAPLTVADGTPAAAKVVLLDTTVHLTAMSLEQQAADGSAAIRVQAGASLETLPLEQDPVCHNALSRCLRAGQLLENGKSNARRRRPGSPPTSTPTPAGKATRTSTRVPHSQGAQSA